MAKNLVVFAVTNNYLFSVANVIIGIEKYAPPQTFDYLIFVVFCFVKNYFYIAVKVFERAVHTCIGV